MNLIKLHESLRLKAYRCSTGQLTIGYGHNLDANGISQDVAEHILTEDVAIAISAARKIYGEAFNSIDEVRRCALVDMAFNMGEATLRTFRKMNPAVIAQDWPKVARQARGSKWFGQTGTRAVRIVQMLETGEWPKDVPRGQG